MEKRDIAIAALAAALVWSGMAVVRLERYHYAAQTGLCGYAKDEVEHLRQQTCLEKAQPRLSSWWDLAYGMQLI